MGDTPSAAFSDHFSSVAEQYASFRPSYPVSLIDWIAGLNSTHESAWDCATGNGQAAELLAARYAHIVATDASAEQIRVAKPNPRITYRVANETDSGLADASMDLVTVAQALHWFDIPAFFDEALRVLRPSGVLAIWSYGKPSVTHAATNDALHWFHDERVGRFWPAERMNVESGYRTVVLPRPDIPAPEWTLSATMPRAGLAGYAGTWSAVRQAKLKEGRDPIPEFESRLREVWPDANEMRTVTWPLTVRACRK